MRWRRPIQSDVTLNSQFATVDGDFTTDKAKRSSLPTYLTVIAIDIAGLLLGVVAALLWDRLFPRITDARSLCEAAGMPVLGVLPSHPAVNKEPRAFVGGEPVAILEDPIRMVLANLTVPQREARARSLAVVGMTSRSGASAVAANLAIVTAELGSTVLLVDADLRKPSLSTIFDVAGGPGLSSVDGRRGRPDEDRAPDHVSRASASSLRATLPIHAPRSPRSTTGSSHGSRG